MREPKAHTRSILKKLVPIYCRGKLVDVGAGRAKYRPFIEKYVDSYTTVDDLSSDDQYQKGRSVHSVDFVSKVDKLPFGSNEFDSALCTEVIEHVEDPFAVVSEISRVLKPGGHLILASGWMAPYHAEPEDYWRFTLAGYKVLGVRAGLEFVTFEAQGGLITSLLFIIARNIDLRGGSLLKKVWRRLYSLRTFLELVAEKLDYYFPIQDTTGHVVVFKKP